MPAWMNRAVNPATFHANVGDRLIVLNMPHDAVLNPSVLGEVQAFVNLLCKAWDDAIWATTWAMDRRKEDEPS